MTVSKTGLGGFAATENSAQGAPLRGCNGGTSDAVRTIDLMGVWLTFGANCHTINLVEGTIGALFVCYQIAAALPKRALFPRQEHASR